MTQSTDKPVQAVAGRPEPGPAPWQRRWYDVIFEADTPAGKAFDVGLLIVILVSVLAVMLESVPDLQKRWGAKFIAIEWVITVLFTFEYLARIACVKRSRNYLFSFFGVVDLLAILPSYLSLFVTGAHALATVRTLRLLRVFRVFRMGEHVTQSQILLQALRQTRPKITVFITVIFCAIVILGTVMYLLERDQAGSGFNNIPKSVYWAVVTMTTVGYGDIAPQTVPGQTLAALIMLLGYCIIIVPTGIFSAEVLSARTTSRDQRACDRCGRAGQDADAVYCKYCGEHM